MCTCRGTTINHVTGLAEELLEYKLYAIFFRFRRTINIMSVYNFLINNSNGQDINGNCIVYVIEKRTLATRTKRALMRGACEWAIALPPRLFFKIIYNLISCIWKII